MCLAAVARLPHVHVFLLPLPCGLDSVFHFGESRGETVSLGSGIPSMPWGVGQFRRDPSLGMARPKLQLW